MENYEELAKKTMADVIAKMHEKDYLGIQDVVDICLIKRLDLVESAIEDAVFPDAVDLFDGIHYSYYKSGDNSVTIESTLYSCEDELDFVVFVDIEKIENGIVKVLRTIDVQ